MLEIAKRITHLEPNPHIWTDEEMNAMIVTFVCLSSSRLLLSSPKRNKVTIYHMMDCVTGKDTESLIPFEYHPNGLGGLK